MLVLGLNPGHDGAMAAVKDGKLLFSLEAEKNSFGRYSPITATTIVNAVERLGEPPDVVAFTGGWEPLAGRARCRLPGHARTGAAPDELPRTPGDLRLLQSRAIAHPFHRSRWRHRMSLRSAPPWCGRDCWETSISSKDTGRS